MYPIKSITVISNYKNQNYLMAQEKTIQSEKKKGCATATQEKRKKVFD